jgi:hypothetical protein
VADQNQLIIRLHPISGDDISITTSDFDSPKRALQTIGNALDQNRSLILTQARSNDGSKVGSVVVNLANVISIQVSANGSAATGQYL